ncbi:MAG: GNAT family N-acetyltransferase [Demequina sp.]
MRVEPIADADFEEVVRAHGHPVPIEQSPRWDEFDATLTGRTPWRRLAIWSTDAADGEPSILAPASAGAPIAVIAFTHYTGRGFRYLWARHGPVWLQEPSPLEEHELRDALRAYVPRADPGLDFMRIHARHEAPDLMPLLQTIPYDRTVQIDLTVPTDQRMAALSKSTRKKLRRALEDDAVVITDETQQAAQDFSEYYEILEETAERDGFGVHGPEVYQAMVRTLEPAARVFVARRHDQGATAELTPGRAVSWILCTTYDGVGTNYYSGQTAEGRATNVGVRLRWELFDRLANEGVHTYDLMGVDSPRAPTLAGVGAFKRQFGPEVHVDGAWDVPLKPWRFRLLVLALRAKRLLGRLR